MLKRSKATTCRDEKLCRAPVRLVVTMLFPEYFPNMFLRIQFRAIAWQVVQGEIISVAFSEIGDAYSLMVRRPINDQDHKAIHRRTNLAQKSQKSILSEIGRLDAVTEDARTRHQPKCFDSFVAPENWATRRLPDTRPSLMNRALRGQTHFILKKYPRALRTCQASNLRFCFSFPAELSCRIGQRQHSLRLLNTETSGVQNLKVLPIVNT